MSRDSPARADARQRVVHVVGGGDAAGVSNTAIRPSPSVLTTWPPWAATICASSATLCVTTAVASALPSVSYIEVLPRRSANSTVRSMIWVMPEQSVGPS